jgi:hypothetical protein
MVYMVTSRAAYADLSNYTSRGRASKLSLWRIVEDYDVANASCLNR